MGKLSKNDSGVRIGNVSGGIKRSIISAGNVSIKKNTVPDRAAMIAQLDVLLKELRSEISKLQSYAPDDPKLRSRKDKLMAKAEADVKSAQTHVAKRNSPAKGVQIAKRLGTTAKEIGKFAAGASALAAAVSKLGGSTQPLGQLVAGVSDKLSAAAKWAASIWQ